MSRRCIDPYCPCQDGEACHYEELPEADTPEARRASPSPGMLIATQPVSTADYDEAA